MVRTGGAGHADSPSVHVQGNQTERMWRRKTSKAKVHPTAAQPYTTEALWMQHKKKQESGFTLRQHVNDMAIPEYDAILDQHAK